MFADTPSPPLHSIQPSHPSSPSLYEHPVWPRLRVCARLGPPRLAMVPSPGLAPASPSIPPHPSHSFIVHPLLQCVAAATTIGDEEVVIKSQILAGGPRLVGTTCMLPPLSSLCGRSRVLWRPRRPLCLAAAVVHSCILPARWQRFGHVCQRVPGRGARDQIFAGGWEEPRVLSHEGAKPSPARCQGGCSASAPPARRLPPPARRLPPPARRLPPHAHACKVSPT